MSSYVFFFGFFLHFTLTLALKCHSYFNLFHKHILKLQGICSSRQICRNLQRFGIFPNTQMEFVALTTRLFVHRAMSKTDFCNDMLQINEEILLRYGTMTCCSICIPLYHETEVL